MQAKFGLILLPVCLSLSHLDTVRLCWDIRLPSDFTQNTKLIASVIWSKEVYLNYRSAIYLIPGTLRTKIDVSLLSLILKQVQSLVTLF